MVNQPDSAEALMSAHPDVFDMPWYRRHLTLVVLGVVTGYFVFCFFAMGLHRAADEFRKENFDSAILDFYSYVEELKVNFRRPERTRLFRDWSALDEETGSIVASIHNRYDVIINNGLTFSLDGTILAQFGTDEAGVFQAFVEPEVTGPFGEIAGQKYTYKPRRKADGSLLNAQIRFNNGSLIKVSKTSATVINRRLGWEYFWFGEGHELTEMTGDEFWSFIGSDETRPITKFIRTENGLLERRTLEVSPVRFVWHSFLDNGDWKHKDVFDKALQSLAMAYCGLVIAAIFAVLLAFPAAQNVSNSVVSFMIKRFLDTVRAIDHLFWALIFIRGGFGQGMLSGISAFAAVETGTLGKLMAEAIENIDNRQPEGVRSTGASEVAVRRYGFIPQVLPVFVSQVLYYFEANVRGATTIGAVCGAGLGLQILNNARNGTDWEDIAYAALIIIFMVFIIDSFTNWLRARLIGIGRDR